MFPAKNVFLVLEANWTLEHLFAVNVKVTAEDLTTTLTKWNAYISQMW